MGCAVPFERLCSRYVGLSVSVFVQRKPIGKMQLEYRGQGREKDEGGIIQLNLGSQLEGTRVTGIVLQASKRPTDQASN